MINGFKIGLIPWLDSLFYRLSCPEHEPHKCIKYSTCLCIFVVMSVNGPTVILIKCKEVTFKKCHEVDNLLIMRK